MLSPSLRADFMKAWHPPGKYIAGIPLYGSSFTSEPSSNNRLLEVSKSRDDY